MYPIRLQHSGVICSWFSYSYSGCCNKNYYDQVSPPCVYPLPTRCHTHERIFSLYISILQTIKDCGCKDLGMRLHIPDMYLWSLHTQICLAWLTEGGLATLVEKGSGTVNVVKRTRCSQIFGLLFTSPYLHFCCLNCVRWSQHPWMVTWPCGITQMDLCSGWGRMQPNIHTHMTLSCTVVRYMCLLEYHDIHITCQSVKVDECTFFVWDNPDSW